MGTWLWQSFAVKRIASCPQSVGSSLERSNARALKPVCGARKHFFFFGVGGGGGVVAILQVGEWQELMCLVADVCYIAVIDIRGLGLGLGCAVLSSAILAIRGVALWAAVLWSDILAICTRGRHSATRSVGGGRCLCHHCYG